MTPRKTTTLLVAASALVLALGMGSVQARAAKTHAKHHAHAVHKKPAHKKTAGAAKPAARAKLAVRTPPVVIVSKTPADAPDFDYQARIQEAQALVARQPVLKADIQVDSAGKLTHFVWTLAVGAASGPLKIVRMDETGKNDAGLTITWPVENFLNTRLRVAQPEGMPAMIVFAQRRPVHAGDSYREAVYTAYAPELDTRTMRAAGMDYLRHLENLAYNHINSHDVRSRVAPNLTVAEEIPRDMVLRLMITEHVDPLHMKYVGIEQCIHEVLITIAANRSHAYAYAKSSAGAMGLPQFMEESYQMVRANYPKALLEPNFALGMTDLRNAMLASVLLLDLELTELPPATLKQFASSSRQFAAYLAAGYNRNPAHVVQTYRRTHSLTGGNVPFENKMYVRLQGWVGEFLKKEYRVPLTPLVATDSLSRQASNPDGLIVIDAATGSGAPAVPKPAPR
jgi:hypothetical protein